MHQVTAQDGEVAYLWRKHGNLVLYGTKAACLRDQLKLAIQDFNHYVRNVKGKRDATNHIKELSKLLAWEREHNPVIHPAPDGGPGGHYHLPRNG